MTLALSDVAPELRSAESDAQDFGILQSLRLPLILLAYKRPSLLEKDV